MTYANRRAAEQMFRDGIRTAYRRGPVVKCAACHKQARFETPRGPRCFSHALLEAKAAQAIEARRAETQGGSVHESAVTEGDASSTPDLSTPLPSGSIER